MYVLSHNRNKNVAAFPVFTNALVSEVKLGGKSLVKLYILNIDLS